MAVMSEKSILSLASGHGKAPQIVCYREVYSWIAIRKHEIMAKVTEIYENSGYNSKKYPRRCDNASIDVNFSKRILVVRLFE